MTTASSVPSFVPLFNRVVAGLLSLGFPMGSMTLLTVAGRKSGQPRTTPVALLERDGHRWLSSPFGEVNWVRNLRAAGKGVVGRGRKRRTVEAVELSPEAAVPVLKDALTQLEAAPMVGRLLLPLYTVGSRASREELIAEARRHPTFELRDLAA
jgi:deazaflavin-dependent oxidoreductase (nitroreductase family)